MEKLNMQQQYPEVKPHNVQPNRSDTNTKTFSLDIKDITKTYFKTTSIKGVAKSCKSDTWPLRIFWMVGFLGGSAIACWLLFNLIGGYFSYDIITKVQYLPNAKPTFPDITVCSINPLPILGERGTTTFQEYTDALDDLLDTMDSGALAAATGLSETDIIHAYDHVYSVTGYINNIPTDTFWEVFHADGGPFWVVHKCKFYDWSKSEIVNDDCSASVKIVFNGQSQICYTIQPNASDADDISEIRAWLYVHDFMGGVLKRYTPLDSVHTDATKGIRLFVHERETFPNVNQGYDISSGTNAILNLRADSYQRLSEPYESCSNDKYIDKLDPVPVETHHTNGKYSYSMDAIKGQCYQLVTMDQCDCYSPYLPVTPRAEKLINQKNLTSCLRMSSYNFTDIVHSLSHINCFTTISYGDKCSTIIPPCTENVYTYQQFQNHWPIDSFKYSFYREVIRNSTEYRRLKFGSYFDVFEEIEHLLADNESSVLALLEENDLIEDNFVQLKVRFQTPGMTQHTSVAALTLERLIGGLGGIFNLWIGFSFITVLEVLELTYRLIATAINYSCKTRKVNTAPT